MPPGPDQQIAEYRAPALTLETMGLPSLSHGFCLRGFGGTSANVSRHTIKKEVLDPDCSIDKTHQIPLYCQVL